MGDIWMYIDGDGRVNTAINCYPSHEAADKMIAALEELKTLKTPEEIDEHNRAEEEILDRPAVSNGPAKKVGYIYVIRSASLYKIGRSKRKDCRISRYRTENPNEIEPIMIVKVDDYIHIEAVVLSMFPEKQHHGEWFSLEEKDIDIIKECLMEIGGEMVALPV